MVTFEYARYFSASPMRHDMRSRRIATIIASLRDLPNLKEAGGHFKSNTRQVDCTTGHAAGFLVAAAERQSRQPAKRSAAIFVLGLFR